MSFVRFSCRGYEVHSNSAAEDVPDLTDQYFIWIFHEKFESKRQPTWFLECEKRSGGCLILYFADNQRSPLRPNPTLGTIGTSTEFAAF